MKTNAVDVVSRVMGVYCDTLLVVSNKLQQNGDDLSIVLKILNRMKEYGTELLHEDLACGKAILDAVYAIEADVHNQRSEKAAVINSCRSGMEVADHKSSSFYCFAGLAARVHFELYQMREGYGILGRAIAIAIESAVDDVEVPTLIRAAKLGDVLDAVRDECFSSSIRQYAMRRCGYDEYRFSLEWNSDSKALLDRLVQ